MLRRKGILEESILGFQKIIAPVHTENHWTCAVADLRQQSFHFYDAFIKAAPMRFNMAQELGNPFF